MNNNKKKHTRAFFKRKLSVVNCSKCKAEMLTTTIVQKPICTDCLYARANDNEAARLLQRTDPTRY